jgi:L-fuculose-phosphate aldolase
MNQSIKQLKELLADISRRSFHRHLIGGTGGNISARIPGTDRVLVTPSGISLADVLPDALIECELDGTIVKAPEGLKPSKEMFFHLGVYELRPDIHAVVHVHPPYSTAFANQGKPLPMSTVSAQVRLKLVPCIDTALPGSAELKGYVLTAVKNNPDTNAFLMKEHGILALGPDLTNAYYTADLIEDTAFIAFLDQGIKNFQGI